MLRVKNVIAIFCLNGFLSGCIGMSEQERAALIQQGSRPVTCAAGPDCEMKWSKSLSWVQRHSRWKLRIASESVIETDGPWDSSAAAFELTKTPLGGGQYQIFFKSWCGSIFGCSPDTLVLRADFVNSVMGPEEPEPSQPNLAAAKAVGLGIDLAKVDQQATHFLKLADARGVVILKVKVGSIAEKSGLLPGDVILKYGDRSIAETADVERSVADTKPGDSVRIEIWRTPGKQMTITANF